MKSSKTMPKKMMIIMRLLRHLPILSWGVLLMRKKDIPMGMPLLEFVLLGKELPFTQEMKFWYETDLINRTLSEDYDIEVEIDTELFPADHFHPFPLPKIEDFPMISLIDQERLKHLASLLEKVHKTKEEVEAMIEIGRAHV